MKNTQMFDLMNEEQDDGYKVTLSEFLDSLQYVISEFEDTYLQRDSEEMMRIEQWRSKLFSYIKKNQEP